MNMKFAVNGLLHDRKQCLHVMYFTLENYVRNSQPKKLVRYLRKKHRFWYILNYFWVN